MMFLLTMLVSSHQLEISSSVSSVPEIQESDLVAIFRDQDSKTDTKKSFVEICQSKGYPVEQHEFGTEDGYILTMFRIGKKDSSLFSSTTPILMQHGLIDSSDSWIINDESLAPGFILANAGYDIWLGNTRGNRHSLKHIKYSTRDKEFWNYSWDEMAKYDIPAEIDYVLNRTSHSKLIYVGHSQGTTDILALLSEKPEFSNKLQLTVLFAPVASLMHQNSPIASILGRSDLLDLLESLGIYHLLDLKDNYILSYVCEYLGLSCKETLFLFSEMRPDLDNLKRLPVIMGHYPSGTSTKNSRHWQQMITDTDRDLKKFDYGEDNMNVYGESYPPIYDLSKISGKIAIFGGKYDRLADSRDVEWLRGSLSSADIVWYRNDYPLGHGTFMWAKSMEWFNDVLEVIETHSV